MFTHLKNKTINEIYFNPYNNSLEIQYAKDFFYIVDYYICFYIVGSIINSYSYDYVEKIKHKIICVYLYGQRL